MECYDVLQFLPKHMLIRRLIEYQIVSNANLFDKNESWVVKRQR